MATPDSLDYLGLGVETATAAVAAGKARTPGPEAVIHSGLWHDAYPTVLVYDRLLTDSAKIQLLYLYQQARVGGHSSVTPMPSVEQTCRALGHARATVVRDRMLLRVTRWLSLCERVRSRDGRWRGTVYALHPEPVSLAEAIAHDAEYMRLLEEAAIGHADARLRRAARVALAAIETDIEHGRDPLRPRDRLETRHQVGAYLRSIARGDEEPEGAWFNIDAKAFGRGETVEIVPTPGLARPGSNFEPGSATPGSNLELGAQPIDSASGSKFELGIRASSSVCSDTLHTGNTGDSARARAREAPPPLRWPETLNDNQRRLAWRHLQRIPAERRQEVLNALEQRMRDAAEGRVTPLRSPVSWLGRLCTSVLDGTFEPVTAPSGSSTTPEPAERRPDPAASRPAVASARIQGEIRALEQLLDAAPGDEARETLRRQIARLRAELRAGHAPDGEGHAAAR